MILILLNYLVKVIFSMQLLLFIDFGSIGALLSGIGSIILAILGIITFVYGPYLLKKWKNLKRREKFSDIAEEALNDLDLFKDDILTWVKFSQAFFVYDRNSIANKKKYDSLSIEKQEKFAKFCDEDKYEVINYVKNGYEILKILTKVKYKIDRLGDVDLEEDINKLNNVTKKLPHDVFEYKTRDIKDEREWVKGCQKRVRDSSEEINTTYKLIHEKLLKYLKFE